MRLGQANLIGWTIGANINAIALSTNSGSLAAEAFIALGSQVSEVYLPITVVGSGGVPAGFLRCRIVTEDPTNNFLPNMNNIIATAYNDANITAAGQYAHFVFDTHTLSEGVRYWLVFDNLHGTGTVSITPAEYSGLHGTSFQWALATYTTSWAYSGTARRSGSSIIFTDGDIFGAALLPTFSNLLTVYSNRLSGLRIQTGNLGYNVCGISFFGGRNGSGCTITYAVYLGNNLIAETSSMEGLKQSAIATSFLAFPSPVALQPNSVYRIVLRNPNGDGSSTNNYRIATPIIARSNSDAEMLWKGTGFVSCVYTESTDGGVTWTDDTQLRYPRAFLMALDPDQPFILPLSSSNPLVINPHIILA